MRNVKEFDIFSLKTVKYVCKMHNLKISDCKNTSYDCNIMQSQKT